MLHRGGYSCKLLSGRWRARVAGHSARKIAAHYWAMPEWLRHLWGVLKRVRHAWGRVSHRHQDGLTLTLASVCVVALFALFHQAPSHSVVLRRVPARTRNC